MCNAIPIYPRTDRIVLLPTVVSPENVKICCAFREPFRNELACAGGGGCVPVEVGGVMLPVERGSDGECPACFPAAATALRRDGRRVPVGELAVGDSVQVGLPP